MPKRVVLDGGSLWDALAEPPLHGRRARTFAEGERQIRDTDGRELDDGELAAKLALQVVGVKHQQAVRSGGAGWL